MDMHIIVHTIEHSLIDSIKLLPFLFITYLVMEYLEHKTSDKMNATLKKAGKIGPLIGSILGAFPQCGFSAAASNLYAGRVITLGTLVAVYLSTSDEMLPIFLSEQVASEIIFKVLLIKIVLGLVYGMLIDFAMCKCHKESKEHHIHEMCKHDHCHCEKGILPSAIKHTLQIFLFIFAFTFILTFVLEWYGEDRIMALVNSKSILSMALVTFIGMIPNCAGSVVVTQLYLEGIIGTGAMIGGLLAGSGVGILVLYRANNNRKENVGITILIFLIGFITGLVMEFLGIRV